MLVTSAEISLFAAAAICLAVIGIDVFRGRSIKMLGAGCVAVFTGLGAYVTLIDPTMSSSAVKLATDVGVLAISLASLIIRKPFVLQYALEEVDAETAKLPGFMKATYIITWAWTGAFVLMISAMCSRSTCRACRSGQDLRSPSPPATVPPILRHGIPNIAKRSMLPRRRTPCPAPTEIIFEPKQSTQQRARR